MDLVARAAGCEDDEYDDYLGAGFAEGADGSGIAVMFQRTRSDPDPWQGDPNETELFDNTYCITVGSGQTVYGGLKKVEFTDDSTAVIEIDPEDAQILGLGAHLLVRFEVPDTDLAKFKAMLPRIVTWGIPAQVPTLAGI
ncbi:MULTISPECIES: Imm10 family immunity protein [Nocardia]|uniref:Uncharacterized protein n=1 Tax=Nocardia sputorum TaxID=2984338 RepID=A0ABM8CYJ0_9NOCA|nr:Imm10 family immunity protein [Nocardia sputorum]BDT91467.1 hypothetical protein IFM12275_14430 [Nocardia sputorum]BDU00103.1 hypothetical protein IFM12276_31310 [Nocardia sputorum]